MYTCQQICNFIADYLEDELPEEERKAFELHISMCWPCREYMKSYKQTIHLARESQKEDPCPEQVPEELISAILTAAPRIQEGKDECNENMQ